MKYTDSALNIAAALTCSAVGLDSQKPKRQWERWRDGKFDKNKDQKQNSYIARVSKQKVWSCTKAR